jgi:hypothetical protein
MSMTMSSTTIPSSDQLTWKQADLDVHVATRGGEFAGFVEFDGSVYVVRDNRGAEIGAFPALDDAFRALEEVQTTARRPHTFPLSLPRVLRRRPRRASA